MAPGELTQLLQQWSRGDSAALDRLMPLVYHELRILADHRLRNERSAHTLQPTALIHEAYLRLVQQDLPDFRNRAHFYGVATQVMRQILVDDARKYRAEKRGGGRARVAMDAMEHAVAQETRAVDLVDLDEALNKLEVLDERLSRMVQLHYFGGMTADEMAELLGISVRTIGRELRTAKAWLSRELGAGAVRPRGNQTVP